MLCLPANWSELNYGGYLTNSCDDLIHSSDFSEHTTSNIPYSLINHLQQTAYTVNSELLEYLLSDGDYLLKHYQVFSPSDLNHNPFDLLSFELSKIFNKHKLYMPIFLDWRGRLYIQNLTLNYQANDFSASLLVFSDGSSLSTDGFYWLRVHGANCYGKDKLIFDNRVKWIDSVHDLIIALDKDFILKADSPIKFAAFCLAYCSYINNSSTIIRLPVFLDATCSGLQHIACLLGDAALGELVNLKGNSRRDLYSETVPVIQEALACHVNPLIRDVLITRTLIKQPIMCIPYSISPIGVRDQLLEFFSDSAFLNHEGNRYYKVPTNSGSFVNLNYQDLLQISIVIYKTVFSHYTSISSIFSYFSKWVYIANKLEISLSWVTPIGTIITPRYLASKASRHSISLNRRTFKLVYYELMRPLKLDKLHMKSSIIPNIIHSLDAAHLFKTVNTCKDLNIDIMTIHDCFGVHPNNIELLRSNIKSAFVEMYFNSDWLEQFHERNLITLANYGTIIIDSDQTQVIKTEIGTFVIPNIPSKSDINLLANDIINSEYIIC
jgi:DNA-directed RNA polymerase